MKLQIKLICNGPSGEKQTTILTESALDIIGAKLDDHDIAGIMFACEFAINNHASEILNRSIRAHLFLI